MQYHEMAERLAGVQSSLYQQRELPLECTIQLGRREVHTHRVLGSETENRLTMTEYLDAFLPDPGVYPRLQLMVEFGKRPEVSLLWKKPTESTSMTLDWGGDDAIDGRYSKEESTPNFLKSIEITAHYDADGNIERAELHAEADIPGYTVPNGPHWVNPEAPVVHYERSEKDELKKIGFTPLEYPVKTGTLVLPDVIPILINNTVLFTVEHHTGRKHILEPAPIIDQGKIWGTILPGLVRKQSVSIPSRMNYELVIAFIEQMAKKPKLLAES
jgi:hypothetical protein